jgi:acyl carrier protein
MLETEFDIDNIPDDDIFRLQTVGQIANYIEAYVEQRAKVVAMRVAEA